MKPGSKTDDFRILAIIAVVKVAKHYNIGRNIEVKISCSDGSYSDGFPVLQRQEILYSVAMPQSANLG